jgi:hypothetical protein
MAGLFLLVQCLREDCYMKLETVESLSSAAAAQQTNSPQVRFGYTSAFVFSHS